MSGRCFGVHFEWIHETPRLRRENRINVEDVIQEDHPEVKNKGEKPKSIVVGGEK